MQTKIKPEILDLLGKSDKYMWAMYQLKQQNQVSEQTVLRWLKNNTRELLIYPNLLILLQAVNKIEIQEIIITTGLNIDSINKQEKLL